MRAKGIQQYFKQIQQDHANGDGHQCLSKTIRQDTVNHHFKIKCPQNTQNGIDQGSNENMEQQLFLGF